MQFRVEMAKNEFMRITESPRGTSHAIRFGRDSGKVFRADRHANLVFVQKADDFSENPNDVRSLVCTVTDGKRSLIMLLTLFPKYGGKGIVKMRPLLPKKVVNN